MKLIPEEPVDPVEFKHDMDVIRQMLKKRGAFSGLSKEQIVVELRRQREEMNDEE